MKSQQTYFLRKNIVVTGAGGGIGSEICIQLSKLGANVYATDTNLDTMNHLKNLENTKTFSLDVREESSWNRILSNFQDIKLDGLIQSAGVLKSGYVYDYSSKEIDYHIDINLKGLILGTNLASKIMKKQKSGHIVHIGSLASLIPVPGMSLYSASKFAVRAFSLAVAQELKSFGISVTVVCPDAVRTPMLKTEKEKVEAALTFSGSTLEPQKVAAIVISTFQRPKLEIVLPFYRSILTKVGNLFPRLAAFLYSSLTKIGVSGQKKFKN